MNVRRRRAGGQRRSRHPMPMPERGEQFAAAKVEEMGAAVRRGPQSELCKRTLCCVCYVAQLRIAARAAGRGELERDEDRRWVVDWRFLPEGTSIPHHEPEGIHGDDDDTIPLCVKHHTGPSENQRHPYGAYSFWKATRIRWEDVRDEMRRRTKLARESG